MWLAGGAHVFVGGGADVSIADLQMACELEQLCLLDTIPGGPTMAELLAPHPALQVWLNRVRERCRPHYDDVNSFLYSVKARMQAAASKM